MNSEKFKSEVFRNSDTVIVNAIELQQLLIKLDSLERQLKAKDEKFEAMEWLYENCKAKRDKLLNNQLTVDLKV